MLQMSHVFLSHAREDKSKANLIRLALVKRGLTVWWDENVQPGERWDERIEAALVDAGAVVILWSINSVHSNWVSHEASFAKLNQTAIQIQLDGSILPPIFEMHQCIDFSKWEERENSPSMDALVEAIRMTYGNHTPVDWTKRITLWVSLIGMCVALFALYRTSSLASNNDRAVSNGLDFESRPVTIVYGDHDDPEADIRLPLDADNPLPDAVLLKTKDGTPWRASGRVRAAWIIPVYQSKHVHLHTFVKENQVEICGTGTEAGSQNCVLYVLYEKSPETE